MAARPRKHRVVEREPIHSVFKPAGVPNAALDEIVLTVEQFEAIRLKDLEGLEQEACAELMHISRPTFQRVLTRARESVARALVEGKALRIEGGHYRLRQQLAPGCGRGHHRRRHRQGRWSHKGARE
ncbi:MAG: DUF134 domain-containing protein [Firmicutes bacterium]|nr:DUF134 domain-containing protein [Bacillota bacterium]